MLVFPPTRRENLVNAIVFIAALTTLYAIRTIRPMLTPALFTPIKAAFADVVCATNAVIKIAFRAIRAVRGIA